MMEEAEILEVVVESTHQDTPPIVVSIPNSTQKIALTQQQLEKIKQDLAQLIDIMAMNQSMISRTAKYWADLPLWQKVAAGTLLTLPTLIIGIIGQIIGLIIFTVFALVTYTGAALLLDDHNNHNEASTVNLKKGVANLATTLGTIIEVLDTLSKKLSQEIEHFQKENELLSKNVGQLEGQVNTLTPQISSLKESVDQLNQKREELELLSLSLNEIALEQASILENTHKSLEKTTHDFQASQKDLGEKVAQLDEVRRKMGIEIEQHKLVGQTLKAAVDSLVVTVTDSEEHRIAFKQKLDEFVQNKEASFTIIVDRICAAERELTIVKEQLQQANERHDALLQRAESQIERLEQVDRAPYPLQKLGFYAAPQDSRHMTTDPNTGHNYNAH